ncbi:methylenetetrahydrofolate reductase [NAD(P)H] [Rhodocaloribacter litoris]|uniref:methylenetetrahydrofolate reductase [NAD(P)H] n=1 Tax=Rhodocaloribacter litoris TaxID=2558931 RepID=UPI00141EC34B|nr:methylenetetrahydrofolate reductase [NAD(P)H] [Rhodocaloribacter litoris]QXD14387.1 methylenetetrahydrofolate reductase [NAD(P)H] [Rhodocaloribacter litoris]GIV60999.1 MAG: methylenetetrahydrofolate reductase [Rhodothermaceae bacterium]
MKIVELLDRASETLISYEIIPPKRGGSVAQIMEIVASLMEFEPPFIDVTSHSAQVYYEEMPDGTWRRHVKRKRPGTLGLCAAIKGRFGVETVPHLLCRGFTREETEDALIELNYLGIHNVMALRGDDNGFNKPVLFNRSRNEYAIDLVHQIAEMNRGRYLEELIDAAPTDFCIGVAGYPEKHFEAPNLMWDILNLKRKVDAGAHYVTTQMFFDNRAFFHFVERCRDVGITVPIIPGLKILTSKKQLQTLPSRFHVEVPEALAAEVEAARDEQVPEIGIEWALRQCEELLNAQVPCIHFYIMQTAAHVKRVVGALRKMA